MTTLNYSLRAVDPFNPDMPMNERRLVTGAKVGFAITLAHAARVLKTRETNEKEYA